MTYTRTTTPNHSNTNTTTTNNNDKKWKKRKNNKATLLPSLVLVTEKCGLKQPSPHPLASGAEPGGKRYRRCSLVFFATAGFVFSALSPCQLSNLWTTRFCLLGLHLPLFLGPGCRSRFQGGGKDLEAGRLWQALVLIKARGRWHQDRLSRQAFRAPV